MTTDGAKWTIDAGGAWLMLRAPSVREAQEVVSTVSEGKPYTVEVKEYRQKRSKDANGLLWELCTQIAAKLQSEGGRITKEDVYRRNIKAAGKCDFVAVVERAVPALIEAWERRGIGWFAELVDNCKIAGCKKLCLYYGSSTYDTVEMSRLIDSVIQDAESVGVKYEPREVKALLEEWEI